MKQDETIKYYHERAGEYDKIYYRNDARRQGEIAQLYALSRRTMDGCRVLDLACGTGFWTRIISEKAKSITGVDINEATLDEARRKSYLCPVKFIKSDFFDLPFEANSFDGLLATFVISHVKRQEISGLFDCVRGTVEPGSKAFFCDNNLICEMVPDLIWDDEKNNSYKKRILENGEEYLILKNYFSREELTSIFEKFGKIERLIFNNYYWAVTLTLK